MRKHILTSWGWAGFFTLAALEALVALLVLATLPADVENSVFLGFSTRRLALLGLLLALAFGCAFLAWLSRQKGWPMRPADPVTRRGWLNFFFALSWAGTVVSLLLPILLVSLYRTGGDYRYFAYYERLLPLIAWVGLFSIQGVAWLAWVGGFQWGALRFLRPSFRAWLVLFAAFLVVWMFIALSGIGVTADVVGWGAPAVPLLEWQVWAAWFVGMGFLFLLMGRRWPKGRDWITAACIWLLAVAVWASQPVQTAYFATAGRAPNYEIYPFSDGAYYGQFAQNILIGNGFEGDQVPPRPLYILLLAGFHALAGQRYESVIFLQTLLLAFFPVVLYFLGRELHSRPAGLVAALLAILREFTAIHTVAITNKASTSQLFFADLPSALAISAWALAAVVWLKAPGKGLLRPLLVGGSLGIAMLFRTQSVFMLLPVAILALLQMRGRRPAWLKQLCVVGLGLAISLAPWLWRNWQVTGQLAFDDPKTQTGVMAQRYSLSEPDLEGEYAMRPGEDEQEYAGRVSQGLVGFLLTRPGMVAGFVSAHLLNAEIDNLLLLPVRDGVDVPQELVMPTRPFWESWDGSPSFLQGLLIALNLGLLALGVGAAWTRLRWAGLTLLFINLAYNGSNALARNSGWRYLLPVDWTVIVLVGVGLMELAVAIFLILGVSPVTLAPHLAFLSQAGPDPRRKSRQSAWAFAGVCATLLLVGSLLPLSERVVPERYPREARDQLAKEVLASPTVEQSGVDRARLDHLLNQKDIVLLKARALYPRFYDRGEGEPRTAKTGYEPLDYPRTVFITASFSFNGLVMLKNDQAPDFLPNASDVLIIGCMRDRYLDAAALLILDEPGGFYLPEGGLPDRCEPSPGEIP